MFDIEWVYVWMMYAWQVLYKTKIYNIVHVYVLGDVINLYNGANKHLIWFDL